MSETSWSVLVTGPLRNRSDWLEAAASAGWEAHEYPLLQVAPKNPGAWPSQTPDWIAITSSSAIPALEAAAARDPELKAVPLAVVGETSAERLYQAGWTPRIVPPAGASHAHGLADAILAEAAPGARIAWPHGARATELGELLDGAGFDVEAPVVYDVETVQHPEPPPRTDAVFFASPSAVQAWLELDTGFAPAGLAIGWTTLDELLQADENFSMSLPLVAPEPQALRLALESFLPSE